MASVMSIRVLLHIARQHDLSAITMPCIDGHLDGTSVAKHVCLWGSLFHASGQSVKTLHCKNLRHQMTKRFTVRPVTNDNACSIKHSAE